MIQWLHRYIFRGLGVLMLIGVVTILIMAISSQLDRQDRAPAKAPVSARP